MATCKASSQGSKGVVSPVPHTRVADDKMIEETYIVGHKLGQGTFGVVREVTHKSSNSIWACKTINKDKAGSSAIKLLENEVSILKKVRHDHIIRLKEVYETSKKIHLILEYCEGGELADHLTVKGTFPESEARTIIERLASATSYLHKQAIVHRDLKLENILLAKSPKDFSDNLYIKVSDFGLSVVKGGASHENMMMDFCGTPMYMAPEIVDNKTYSERCDVWAMGVIAYLLMAGVPPFQSKDEEKLYDIIKNADVEKSFSETPVWKDISAEAKDCIKGMLTKDPAHRLTASEVLDNPWITGEASTDRPKNVLEMMKEWRNDLSGSDSVNGIEEKEPVKNPVKTPVKTPEMSPPPPEEPQKSPAKSTKSSVKSKEKESSTSKRHWSTNNNNSNKSPSIHRVSTEPFLTIPSPNPRSCSIPRSGAKSKSPVERISNVKGRSLSSNRTGHHTARTTATKTTNGTQKTAAAESRVKKKSR